MTAINEDKVKQERKPSTKVLTKVVWLMNKVTLPTVKWNDTRKTVKLIQMIQTQKKLCQKM